MMRLQLALNVEDLEQAIEYYRRLFGVEVNKRREGYANFVVDSHGLKLVLFEAPGAERLNHLGFELDDDADVDGAAERLEGAGVLAERQNAEVCCFARQNKAISYDPQGLMWEWYRVLEDSPTFYEAPAASTQEPAAGCCAEAQTVVMEAGRGCCG